MGLLDFFSRRAPSSVHRNEDRIWLTVDGLREWLTNQLQRSANGADGFLLVAHFANQLDSLETLRESAGLACGVSLAGNLSPELAARLSLSEESVLDVFVVQHHPLPRHDDRIVEFAESLPCRCRLTFLVSADDPLMQILLGDAVRSVLRSLGMQESESIQSGMVTRRLRKSQEKFARQLADDVDADSIAEWLVANAPRTT